MSYFDTHPQIFRGLALLLLAVAWSLAFYTVARFASSPTDENWFRDSPSRLYATRNIPAHPQQGAKRQSAAGSEDSVMVGDLILAVNGNKVLSAEEVESEIHRSAPGIEVRLSVFRPTIDQKKTLSILRDELRSAWYRVIPTTAHVYDVFPQGASDRAGMKVGDLIFRINGNEFSSSNVADLILRRAQVGRAIIYDVLRANETIELHVTLAKFGLPIQLLFLSAAGFSYLLFASVLLVRRPNIKAARMLGLTFLLFGFFIMTVGSRREVDLTTIVIIRNVLIAGSLFFGIAFALWSMAFFPREWPEMIRRRWIAFVLYLLAAVGWVGVAVANYNAFLYMIFVQMAFGLGVKWWFRKERSAEYIKLNRTIRWAGVLTVIITLLISLPLRLFTNNQQAIVIGILVMLFLLAHVYTIGRYRLLSLDFRIRRNIQYTVLSVVWWAVLVLAVIQIFLALPSWGIALPNVIITGSSIEVTDASVPPAQRELTYRIFFMVVAVVVFSGVHWIRRKGQEFIDRKYYRTSYDYRRAAKELSEVLSTKLSMVALGRGLVETVAGLMKLKRAGVLFFQGGHRCCCQEVHGFEGGDWQTFCVAHEGSLVEAIKKFDGPFRVEYLPSPMKENFRSQQFQYAVPIYSKDKLVGTILVGEKRSELPFHQEDFEFLSSAAGQAALSVENAFLYEELAENERMKHELEIARRIQLQSLPQEIPNVRGLDIAGSSHPAMEVGGDFFDYLNGSPDQLTVIVGDVSGKGTSAAMYMSKVQGIFRSLHEFNLAPRELFIRANRLLCKDLERRSFVTVLGATFDVDRKTCRFARAGHLPLFVYRASDRRVEIITPKGLGLGLNDEELFADELQQVELSYNEGDVLVFVTDGVTEAHRTDGEQYGEERVVEVLAEAAHQSAEVIQSRLLEHLRSFADTAQHDDETIVVVKAV
ncbi:MAG: SpoIIE family protein phosphatase [Ignavibacteriales bacterium]|nr:SpoIIE family protein phosphatase [Ignavibacteriales bacterium]